ncbi:hypothetical protein CYMTET_35623 [Cymbomonas tetramitiformis]|uniref:Bacteriophage/plasmid primase P4 C-terminal domain-containing protein n=1 Tax=Cymbomonas tetramitiformis TaxID=36881 RepID=A0AAE0F8T7_9CHLO|nr:hypothetical protein CYMTET_35623 [Cymbomonas tetramitiformis]
MIADGDAHSTANEIRALDTMKHVVNEDFSDVVREVHRENRHVHSSILQDVTTTLVRAILEPAQQMDIGLYLFFVTNRVYRYGFDETQGVYLMYRYDGARWTSYGTRENFACEAQEFLVDILQGLYIRWINFCRKKGMLRWIRTYCRLTNTDPRRASRQDRVRVRKNIYQILRRYANVKLLYSCVSREKGVKEILHSCEKRMKSSVSCEAYSIPTPSAFYNMMDEHDHLIGFNNGIYDLSQNAFYGRNMVPKDYFVSISVGYDYVPIDDEIRAHMKSLYDTVYMRVFPNPVTRRQIQAVVGAMLDVGNTIKKLVLLLGRGDNGKTAFVSKFLKCTLGGYFGTVPVQILMETKGMTDAQSTTLNINRKKRCIAMNEGDQRLLLNSGTTKTLTGNDEISFRNIYKQPASARFHATLVYLSNVAPRFEAGQALRNRAYPIDCMSTFEAGRETDDVKNHVYGRMSDDEFYDRCMQWRMAHMHLAIQWWSELRQNRYEMPPIPVNSYAKKMIDRCSADGLFVQWFLDNYKSDLRIPRDETKVVRVKDVRSAYNAQTKDPSFRFLCEMDCKRMIRGHTGTLVKEQQRVGARNIKNYVCARLIER